MPGQRSLAKLRFLCCSKDHHGERDVGRGHADILLIPICPHPQLQPELIGSKVTTLLKTPRTQRRFLHKFLELGPRRLLWAEFRDDWVRLDNWQSQVEHPRHDCLIFLRSQGCLSVCSCNCSPSRLWDILGLSRNSRRVIPRDSIHSHSKLGRNVPKAFLHSLTEDHSFSCQCQRIIRWFTVPGDPSRISWLTQVRLKVVPNYLVTMFQCTPATNEDD